MGLRSRALLIATLALCGCTTSIDPASIPSATASPGRGENPSPTAANVLTAVVPLGALSATVEIDDFDSIVAAVGPADVPVLSASASTTLDQAGILVLDNAGGGLLVIWTTGPCSPRPDLAFTRTGSGIQLVLDHGPPSSQQCDLLQTALAVIVRPSSPLRAGEVVASVHDGSRAAG